MYIIYWLISEDYKKTYIGFSDNIKERIKQHKNGQVKTTKNLGKFRCFKLEKAVNLEEARKKEKYWKSCAGRKKLSKYFENIKINGPFV